MTNSSAINEIKTVVNGGYCVGCGSCAIALNTDMNLNSYGEYNPNLKKAGDSNNYKYSSSDTISICPFLAPELNENVLAQPLFSDDCEFDSSLGYYHSVYAGFVKEASYRADGTSGGMGTWIGAELLRLGEIDGVIHVKPVENRSYGYGDPYFEYDISRTLDEIKAGAKTRYHVVEISKVMEAVRDNPGRYLFIGVPCFSKAVRRLQRVDPVIAERIKYVGSLICGHLKSVHWTMSLAWGVGIEPKELSAFQYRTKGPDIAARSYVFRATGINKEPVQQSSASVVGGKFNAGAMMLNACDYCDDVVGETADITIGDAWISKYEVDSYGTNLVIIRNKQLNKILTGAEGEGRLFLKSVLVEEAVASQAGGFRQRREGLSYRLDKANSEGRWVPIKRVKPGSFELSSARKKIYDSRVDVAKESREAFRDALKANNYAIYSSRMGSIMKKLRFLELKNSFFRAFWNRITRYLHLFKRKTHFSKK